MRIIFAAFLCLLHLAPVPAASAPTEVVASRSIHSPVAFVSANAEAPGDYQYMQEFAIGALILGGAFAVGLIAGAGSLSTGLTAAGAVTVFYVLRP